jgi:hypothetical protein
MKKPVGRQPGYTVSEETKALISKSSKGRVAVNKRGVVVNGVAYESIRIAAKTLDVKTPTLVYRCLSQSEAFKEWNFV